MFETFLKAVKTALILTVLTAILFAIGKGINSILPWQYLGYGFTILYNLFSIFDFFIDVPTLWTVLGYALDVMLVFVGYKAGFAVVSRFSGSQD